MSFEIFSIDNYPHQNVALKGEYNSKVFKRKDKGPRGDGTVFLAEKTCNVNKFHCGKLFFSNKPHTPEYIDELLTSINSGNLGFKHKNGEYTKLSQDGLKLFTVYKRYIFGYDTLNKVTLKSTSTRKEVIITNSSPKIGDHQYALKITDYASGMLEVFGLYW